MAKIIFVSVLVLAIVAFVSAGSVPEDLKEVQPEVRKNCLAETGVDEAMIEKAVNGDFADDEKLKCYMKCTMDQFRLINKKGINFQAMLALTPPSMKEKVEATIKGCKDEQGSDICDTVFNVNKCIYKMYPEDYFIM